MILASDAAIRRSTIRRDCRGVSRALAAREQGVLCLFGQTKAFEQLESPTMKASIELPKAFSVRDDREFPSFET